MLSLGTAFFLKHTYFKKLFIHGTEGVHRGAVGTQLLPVKLQSKKTCQPQIISLYMLYFCFRMTFFIKLLLCLCECLLCV